MTGASIGQKIISFFYFSFIARTLGPASTGAYFFALSFTTIFVVFVDLGLTNVLIREAAKEKTALEQYLANTIAIKIFLGLFTYTTMLVYLWWVDPHLYHAPIAPQTLSLIYISGITMLFDSFNLTIYGSLRALGKLQYEAIGIVASQFLTLTLGGLFLFFHARTVFLMVAFLVPSVLSSCFAVFVLTVRHGIRLRAHIDPILLRRMVRIGTPFALAAIFARVYGYSDTFLLSRLAGDQVLGWYSIPYKITFAFQFIPLALIAAFYPRLSECYATNKEKIGEMMKQSFVYLWLISFPVVIGIGVLSHDIIIHLYTKSYAPSIMPLRILIVSLIFSFISFPLGACLNACDRQKTQTTIVGIVMVLNIIMNLFLIPHWGAVGAAVSALIGNVLLTVVGYAVVTRVTTMAHREIFMKFFQIFLSAVLMGVVVWLLGKHVYYLVAILCGIPMYVCCLLLTRTISVAMIRETYSSVKKMIV